MKVPEFDREKFYLNLKSPTSKKEKIKKSLKAQPKKAALIGEIKRSSKFDLDFLSKSVYESLKNHLVFKKW